MFFITKRASRDQVLARCVQWQSAVFRLVCFGLSVLGKLVPLQLDCEKVLAEVYQQT